MTHPGDAFDENVVVRTFKVSQPADRQPSGHSSGTDFFVCLTPCLAVGVSPFSLLDEPLRHAGRHPDVQAPPAPRRQGHQRVVDGVRVDPAQDERGESQARTRGRHHRRGHPAAGGLSHRRQGGKLQGEGMAGVGVRHERQSESPNQSGEGGSSDEIDAHAVAPSFLFFFFVRWLVLSSLVRSSWCRRRSACL